MEQIEKKPKFKKQDTRESKVKVKNTKQMLYIEEITQDNEGMELGLGILYNSLDGFGVNTKTTKILKKSSNEEKNHIVR
jgi:hypothetical protein